MINLNLLGRFRVEHTNGIDITPRSQKACAILAYLALAPKGTASRDKLIGLLWGNSPEEQARASLRQSLNVLRRCVNGVAPEFISAGRQSVRLDLAQVRVDAMQLKELAQSLSWDDKETWQALCHGELLDGLAINDPLFDEWLYTERAYYRSLLCTTLERLLAYHCATATVDAAMAIAQSLLSLEPAHEEAHRSLMRLYMKQGNPTLALRQYHTCRNLLARAFHIPPSEATEALHHSIRSYRSTSSLQSESKPGWSSSLPDAPQRQRTSIAVMPFRNLSGDPAQDDFAEGLAEDITAALSKFTWLFVIAHRTTLRYNTHDLDVGAVGSQLGVRYMLDGSVRSSSGHLRLTVDLIKVEDTTTLWAAQYDVAHGELFAIQDQITATIVGQLAPKLRISEIERVSRKPPEQLDAHDSVLRAIALMHTMSYEPFLEARECLHTAIARDPIYATAYAWLAFWYILLMGQGWTSDVGAAMTAADRYARSALEYDPEDALALTIAAHVTLFRYHRFDQALRLCERALQLNPNLAFAWTVSAATYCYLGEPEEALKRLHHARQLCPVDPYGMVSETIYCLAYTVAGRYVEAAAWGRQVVHNNPNFINSYKPLIASIGHLGLLEEAREYLRRLLRLEPDFSISAFRKSDPFHKESDRERYIEGLRKAGVPECSASTSQHVMHMDRRKEG